MINPATLFPPQHVWPEPRTPVANWIDVSNHQGFLSGAWFDMWTQRGYHGLIVQGVESMEGETFTRQQLGAALGAGWSIAGYVWLRAGQRHDLRALQRRLEYFNGFALEFLALDIEDLSTTRQDVEMGLTLCDAWQNEYAWIYTAQYVFEALGFSDEAYWPDRKLWTAKYDGIADVDRGFEPYGGWTRCDMKQWTDQPVDQNVRRV